MKVTHVIVNDGELRYPVAVSDLRPEDTEQSLRSMSRSQYDKWVATVPSLLRNEVFLEVLLGSPEVARELDAMCKAGCAEEWHVQRP